MSKWLTNIDWGISGCDGGMLWGRFSGLSMIHQDSDLSQFSLIRCFSLSLFFFRFLLSMHSFQDLVRDQFHQLRFPLPKLWEGSWAVMISLATEILSHQATNQLPTKNRNRMRNIYKSQRRPHHHLACLTICAKSFSRNQGEMMPTTQRVPFWGTLFFLSVESWPYSWS